MRNLDVMAALASINPDEQYQRGKALEYGRRTVETYKLVYHHANKNNCSPRLMPLDKDADKEKIRSQVLANQLYGNLVNGVIDNQDFRRHFRREAERLLDFCRLVDRVAAARGQLPQPPMGFQQIETGPDKGKLGFPEGHPLHPDTKPAETPTDTQASSEAAYAQGCAAYVQGQPLTSNPWPRTNREARAEWERGWQETDSKLAGNPTRAASSEPDPPEEVTKIMAPDAYGFYKKLKAADLKKLVNHVGGATSEERRNNTARAKFLAENLAVDEAKSLLGGA